MLTSNKEWVLPSAQDDIASQLVNKSYQQKQRSAILSFIKSKGCKFRNCCDIGAHIGIWSEDLVKYFQHVFAFEPIKELRDCFIKNVSGKNYTLYPFGLSESDGKIKFDFDPKRSKNTCVDSVGNYISEVKRLDDLNLKNIDYIKMDVESHELKILKGAQRLLEDQSPFVHLEMKNKQLKKINISKQDIKDWLNTFGYNLEFKLVNEYVFKKNEIK